MAKRRWCRSWGSAASPGLKGGEGCLATDIDEVECPLEVEHACPRDIRSDEEVGRPLSEDLTLRADSREFPRPHEDAERERRRADVLPFGESLEQQGPP